MPFSYSASGKGLLLGAPPTAGRTVLLLRATSGADGRDEERHRSLPEFLELLTVASLGLPATDADHVKAFRAGLE